MLVGNLWELKNVARAPYKKTRMRKIILKKISRLNCQNVISAAKIAISAANHLNFLSNTSKALPSDPYFSILSLLV